MNTQFAPQPSGRTANTNTLAIISLVTGILGILTTCPTFFVPFVGLCSGVLSAGALITGFISKNQITHQSGNEQGKGMAVAGIVLGLVNLIIICVLVVIGILVFFGVFVLPFSVPFLSPSNNYTF